MPGIAIMTDSNCGIMPSEADKYGIYVLPMPVIIDGETYYEGINITLDEFYKKQAGGRRNLNFTAVSRGCDRYVG